MIKSWSRFEMLLCRLVLVSKSISTLTLILTYFKQGQIVTWDSYCYHRSHISFALLLTKDVNQVNVCCKCLLLTVLFDERSFVALILDMLQSFCNLRPLLARYCNNRIIHVGLWSNEQIYTRFARFPRLLSLNLCNKQAKYIFWST